MPSPAGKSPEKFRVLFFSSFADSTRDESHVELTGESTTEFDQVDKDEAQYNRSSEPMKSMPNDGHGDIPNGTRSPFAQASPIWHSSFLLCLRNRC